MAPRRKISCANLGALKKSGAEIHKAKQDQQRQELLEIIDNDPESLEMLLFISKSGMLAQVANDMRRDHWLPQSNERVRHLGRSFMATALGQMSNTFNQQTTLKLAACTPEDIDRLYCFGTGYHRNDKIPTLHKKSLLQISEERHKGRGNKLDVVKLEGAGEEVYVAWDKSGVYTRELNGEGTFVVAILRMDGEKVKLKRPAPADYIIKMNWSAIDAKLADADDSDETVINKLFAKESKGWTAKEDAAEYIAQVEAHNEADKVRLALEGGEASSTPSKDRSRASESAKRACSDNQMPDAPEIMDLKVTRRLGGSAKKARTTTSAAGV